MKATKLLLIDIPRNRSGKGYVFNQILLWLASYGRQLGLQTYIYVIDEVNKSLLNSINFIIDKYNISTILLSNKWWHNLYAVIKVAQYIRSGLTKKIPVLVGGLTASCFHKELIKFVDGVIVGDGFSFIEDLIGLSSIKDICSLDNVYCIEKKKIKYKKSNIEDIILSSNLDNLFINNNVNIIINGYIWSGVGCSERCFYCVCGNKNPWLPKYQMRPSENIIHDIFVISKYRRHVFFDFDDVDRRYNYQYNYVDIFRRVKTLNLYLSFFSWTNPLEELLEVASSTFKYASFYIDTLSFSQKVQDRIKNINVKSTATKDDILNILNYIDSKSLRNIFIGTTGIFGYPFISQSEEVFEEIKVIQKLLNLPNYRGSFYSFLHVLPCSFQNIRHISLEDDLKFRIPTFYDYLNASRRFFFNQNKRYYSKDIMKYISPYVNGEFEREFNNYKMFINMLNNLYRPKVNFIKNKLIITDIINPFNTIFTILNKYNIDNIKTIMLKISYLYDDIDEHIIDSSEILDKVMAGERVLSRLRSVKIITDQCERIGFLKKYISKCEESRYS